MKTMKFKKAKKYVVVTFTTIYDRTNACVIFTGTKKQCDKYVSASDLLAAEVMTENKYNNIVTCLM